MLQYLTSLSPRYDLDPLYTKGNIAWSGMLNLTQTALYVRACGQLAAGTGCDHSAGVCAVTVSIIYIRGFAVFELFRLNYQSQSVFRIQSSLPIPPISG